MALVTRSFRRWWRPPRKTSEREEERRVTFLEHVGEPLASEVAWLLTGSLSLVPVTIALLMATLRLPEEYRLLYRRAGWVTLFSALVSVLLGLTNLATIPLLAALNLLLLLPVLYGLKVCRSTGRRGNHIRLKWRQPQYWLETVLAQVSSGVCPIQSCSSQVAIQVRCWTINLEISRKSVIIVSMVDGIWARCPEIRRRICWSVQ